jgi:hypothetical protein
VPSGAAEHPSTTDPTGPEPAWSANRPKGWGKISDSIAGWGTGVAEDGADSGQNDEHDAQHDELSGRLDDISNKLDTLSSGNSARGGVAGSGLGGSSGQYQQSGNKQTPFATPVSAIQQQAQKHQASLESMLAGNQHLAATRQGTAAQFARRQAASSAGMAPASGASANGQGNSSASNMNGVLRNSGPFSTNNANGQSQASFESSRFGG